MHWPPGQKVKGQGQTVRKSSRSHCTKIARLLRSCASCQPATVWTEIGSSLVHRLHGVVWRAGTSGELCQRRREQDMLKSWEVYDTVQILNEVDEKVWEASRNVVDGVSAENWFGVNLDKSCHEAAVSKDSASCLYSWLATERLSEFPRHGVTIVQSFFSDVDDSRDWPDWGYWISALRG